MSIRYLDLSGAVNFWTNIKNFILSKIPTKTSELTNDSGYLTSHQSLDNYVTLDSNQTITAIKTITGGNQGKMVFKNPDYTKGDAVESGTTISRLYFGNGASYATANGVLTTDINSAGNTSLELGAMNNTASSSYRASLILTYDKSATRPRFIKSWGDFCPYSDDTYYLGRSDSVWKECYCNAYYLGTTAFGDIVTHNASEFLTEHQSLANYALDANVVHTSGDETIAGKKSFNAMPSILGSYLGNEFSTNARTCLYLKSNRDTDGQSGIYFSKFRQNVAQGALTGSSLVNLTLDVLENSVRTNSCITINFRYFENDVPTEIYVIPKASMTSYMGTANNPWTNIYGTNIYGSFTGNLTGDVTGNATTATEFNANKDVTLTGDVTGTASSKAGWSVATTLADSGVTAGTYGPSADVTGSDNATILVPEITVDAKGRVTAVTNRTYKSVNTDSDKKVYQYYKSDDNVYRLLFSNNSGNTATSNVGAVYSGLNNSFYVNPSTGSLYATKLYSGGTEVKVTDYDTHIADTDIHVTTADKNRWNNQTYVFRYSSTALVASSTNSNTLLDNTDNLKVGDKVIDSSGVIYSVTAIDTANSTFTIGTALVDLALDANVMHLSGNESASGDKNFKGLLTTIPSRSLWPAVSLTSDDITLLGNSVVHLEQLTSGRLADLGSGAWNVVELGAGAFFFRNNTGTDIRFKNLATGDVNRIPLVSGANRFIHDVTPNQDNIYDLGSSSLRWSTINGINPGALSLPDLYNGIDISGYLTTGSTSNTYTALADGYISILTTSSTDSAIYWSDSNGIIGGNAFSAMALGGTNRVTNITFPVNKGESYIIVFKSVRAVVSAYFYPCQGNV